MLQNIGRVMGTAVGVGWLAVAPAWAGPLPFSFTSTEGGTAQPGPGLSVVALTPGALPAGVQYAATQDTGGVPNGIVRGNASNEYSAPYISQSAQVTDQYYSTARGSITFSFAHPEGYFGLLWGSVDAGNELTFYSGSTTLGSIFGSDITLSANGTQSLAGSRYVNVDFTQGFDRAVATSKQVSFEFASVVAEPARQDVPEPGAFAVVMSGLVGFVALRRMRSKHAV